MSVDPRWMPEYGKGELLVDKYSNTDWLRLRDLLSRDFNRVPLAIPVSRVSSSVALGN